MKTLLSVIIPTKNRKALLEVTLENIFRQTLPPDEVIVIDDQSDDGTYEMLSGQYQGRVIALKGEGKGPGAARNKGLGVATGKYIQFFDSDDLMTLNKLEDQVGLLEKTGRHMAYGPYIMAAYTEKGWEHNGLILNYHPINASLYQCMVRGWNIITQACLFSREVIDRVPAWDETLMTHEDYLYLYEVSKEVEEPVHSNQSATIYRQHHAQLTDDHTIDLQRAKNALNVLRKMEGEKQTILDAAFIKGRKYHTSKYAGIQNESHLFEKFSGIFSYYLYKGSQKWGRIQTKSDWQPFHGGLKDENIVHHYLDQL